MSAGRPSTEEVLAAVGVARERHAETPDPTARIKAEVLREAANDLAAVRGLVDPNRLRDDITEWLTARADRIERGES